MSRHRGVYRRLFSLLPAVLLFVVAVAGCQGPTTVEGPTGTGRYQIIIKPDPLTLNPPQLATLSHEITDTENNERVSELDPIGGVVLHNIVIRDDLQYFRHSVATSVLQEAASVLTYFPTTGRYHAYTLFKPAGEPLEVFTTTISSGTGEDHADMVVDEATFKVSGGVRVDLLTGADPIRVNQPTQLVFRVTERGQPVTGLWPLYEAPGHLWIVNDHGEDFAHLEAASASRRLVAEPTSTVGAAAGTSGASGTASPGRPGSTPTAGATAVADTAPPTFAPAIIEAIASATSVAAPTFRPVQGTAQASVYGTPDVRPTFGYGPELAFTHTFPHEGLYKMWLEIKYREMTLLYDYFVRVEP